MVADQRGGAGLAGRVPAVHPGEKVQNIRIVRHETAGCQEKVVGTVEVAPFRAEDSLFYIDICYTGMFLSKYRDREKKENQE